VSLGDTWSWDGGNWNNNNPTTAPPLRSAAAVAFDATRGVVVLFGGMTGSANRADTWTWDGANWSQVTPATSPPPRSDAAFGFDPATQSAVLFGGTGNTAGTALRDTWIWNGSTWSTSLPISLLPALSPPARIGAGVAASAQRLVLFGGQSGSANPSALGDTWTIATAVPVQTPPPTTVAGPATSTTTAGTSIPPTTKAGTSTTSVPKAPPTTRPPAPAALAVTSRSVRRGDPVTVSGNGFMPGSTITITFHSVRVVVGTTVADAEGRFTATVVVPNDAQLGEHHIEAAGAARSGGQAVLVAQVSIARPSNTHGWLLPVFMVALTVLLAAGAGVVLTASARWPRSRRLT
jgi:hypothetical protein